MNIVNEAVYEYSQANREQRTAIKQGMGFIYFHLTEAQRNHLRIGFTQIDNLEKIKVESEPSDLDIYFNTPINQKPKTMGKSTVTTGNRKEVGATESTRKEVEITNIPFFKFEAIDETFNGQLLEAHSITIDGKQTNTYTAKDSDGEIVLMPSNVQLQIKLGIVAQNNPLPCNIEVVFTGTVKTAKGNAKQFKVYTL